MYRHAVLELLENYSHLFVDEKNTVDRVRDFVLRQPKCFDRDCIEGHVTGSALILTPDFQNVLLTYHAKLQKWLQLGGHSDGNPWPWEVAKREGLEESGLSEIILYSPRLFDLDMHEIPASKKEPAHLHYDFRFVFLAPRPDEIKASSESIDLRWFSFSEAYACTSETSMHRQFEKAKRLITPRPLI